MIRDQAAGGAVSAPFRLPEADLLEAGRNWAGPECCPCFQTAKLVFAMIFKDRTQAGRLLAKRLENYREQRPLVLGIPRGGVVVAAEVAAALQAELDVVIARKIGAPFNPEMAVGAVAPDGTVVYDEHLLSLLGLSRELLQGVVDKEIKELRRRLNVYRQHREEVQCRGRTVILVDDGIATGHTLEAVVAWLRQQDPDALVLAVPVAPAEALNRLQRWFDRLVCLELPETFMAVGQFYQDFSQVDDSLVVSLLAHNSARPESK